MEEFAKGGSVDKNNGVARFAEGGEASAAELLRRQLQGIDNTPTARTPEPATDVSVTESRSMLDRLKGAGSAVNRAFYENISKPAVGAAVDMTVGLGDLARMGARYLGDRAGMDTGEFTPAAPRVREALGVEGYDPYSIGSIATQILPFAAAGRTAASAPTAAGQLQAMFPNIGREVGAYTGAEVAGAAAQEIAPDSTAAQLLASVAGGMGGSSAFDPALRIDGPRTPGEDVDALTALDQPPAGSAASMLDDLDQATTPDVRLSRAELGRVNASVGSNRNKQRLMKEEARRIKGNFLPTNGWEAIEFSGVKKGKPEFKKIAYGFQKPPAGMEKEAWANSLSDNLVREVDGVVERARSGDQAALGILQQANWYRGMRDQLRSEFGGIGDVFADVLGTTSAQTNVEQNFSNASEILRRYSRGEFDAELQAYENRIKQGLPVDGKTLTALHNAGEFPLITNSAGKLFNTNSPSSMGALLDMFRSVKTGSAPKTPNFTGNLIGLTNEATVDVWAARMLRRLSGQSRIPPVAEQGVTGTHLVGSSLGNPRVGGEFGFGQDVFRSAANRINQSGNVKDIVPEMGDLGPDDLQAVAWFMEKERWTNNGWTTKAGEGGSLEYEMSLAGSPEQDRIDSLRREINAGFKAPNKRKKETDAEYAERVAQARRVYDNKQELAGIELQSLSAPLQRYTVGVSGERPNLPMSNYAQAELAAEIDDVVRNDSSVLGYNLANTYGSFMGDTERALNAEFVVQQNFDPSELTRRLVEQGKNYDQDAVFISRSVPASSPDARPGAEIFFKEEVSPEDLAKITARLREYGIDGFTYITDMRFDDRVNRQARSGAPETAKLTGLRFQYIPEFDEGFDPRRADEIYKEKEDLFRDVLADTMADQNVSDIRFNYYDTQVFFRDGYDEYLTRTAPKRSDQTGGEVPGSAGSAQSNRSGGQQTELPEPVRDRGGQATTRPVNEQLGIDRAKSMVEESGYRWNDVKQLTSNDEYLQFQRQYGIPSAVSEGDNPTDVFNKGGALFFNEDTGAPVAYATSGASRNKPPEGFARGGAVTSSRRMLENLIGKKPEGQRVDATGLQRFANGGEADAELLRRQLENIDNTPSARTPERAPTPEQTESRAMLERLGRFASLDTPQDMGLGETAADIGMGFLPVVGTAQGARDFERARRDEDKLGMLLSAASMIPVAGGAVRAIRSAGKAADVVEEVPGAARQMLDEVVPPATTEQIKQVEASAPIEKSPVPSYYMDEWTQETGLSPQEIENFWRLGDNQRGLPEYLMVKAQRELGGGVLFPAIEHIGDLTNRMTPKHSLGFAYEETLGKAQRYLRSLKSGYGFRREFEENLRNNAQFNGESLEEHKSKVNAALDAYADAHEKLVTYNPLQTIARDAAVSLGRRDFEKAATLLQDFVDRIPTREDFVAEMRATPQFEATTESPRELRQKLQVLQEQRRASSQR
jgi:hypothetical protein